MNSTLKKTYLSRTGILVSIFFLTFILFFMTAFFQRWHWSTFDDFLTLRGRRTPPREIIMVVIDDTSLSSIGYPWPWPRKVFARALENLYASHPKTVALDFIFSGETSKEEDKSLSLVFKKLASSSSLVLGIGFLESFDRESLSGNEWLLFENKQELPLPQFEGTLGFINIPIESDDSIRRTLPLIKKEEKSYLSFALAAALAYSGIAASNLVYHPRKNLDTGKGYSFSLDDSDSFLIDFIGPPGTFRKISFHQLFQGNFDKEIFRDKLVLIGPTFVLSRDFHFTPFADFKGLEQRMPGIEIHAAIIENILYGRHYKSTPSPILFIFVLFSLFLISGCYLFSQLYPKRFLLVGLFLLITFGLNLILFFHARYFFASWPVFFFLILYAPLLELVFISIQNRSLQNLLKEKPLNMPDPTAFFKKFDISKREQEIIYLLVQGMTNEEIGKKLFISLSTVKKHVYNIYQKTHIKNKVELMNLMQGLS